MCVHLHQSEKTFWCSTHCKIVELLDIDREVNTIPETKGNKSKKQTSERKLSLAEVQKLL